MEISTCRDGSGEEVADGVDGLEDALDVTSSCDFFNEDGRETLGTQLLVHTEEVDFGSVEDVFTDAELDGDAGDERNELLGGGSADTDVPEFPPARCFECPDMSQYDA